LPINGRVWRAALARHINYEEQASQDPAKATRHYTRAKGETPPRIAFVTHSRPDAGLIPWALAWGFSATEAPSGKRLAGRGRRSFLSRPGGAGRGGTTPGKGATNFLTIRRPHSHGGSQSWVGDIDRCQVDKSIVDRPPDLLDWGGSLPGSLTAYGCPDGLRQRLSHSAELRSIS